MFGVCGGGVGARCFKAVFLGESSGVVSTSGVDVWNLIRIGAYELMDWGLLSYYKP